MTNQFFVQDADNIVRVCVSDYDVLNTYAIQFFNCYNALVFTAALTADKVCKGKVVFSFHLPCAVLPNTYTAAIMENDVEIALFFAVVDGSPAPCYC